MATTSLGVGEHGEVFIKDGISSGRYTEGCYGYPQGQHVVLYLLGQGCIEIISIPHKEMDIVSYFLPE